MKGEYTTQGEIQVPGGGTAPLGDDKGVTGREEVTVPSFFSQHCRSTEWLTSYMHSLASF